MAGSAIRLMTSLSAASLAADSLSPAVYAIALEQKIASCSLRCNLQHGRHTTSQEPCTDADQTLAILACHIMLSFWKSRFSTAACGVVHNVRSSQQV